MDIKLTRMIIRCGTLVGLSLEVQVLAKEMIVLYRVSELAATPTHFLLMIGVVWPSMSQSAKNLSKKMLVTH